jgi:hypothetical protein
LSTESPLASLTVVFFVDPGHDFEAGAAQGSAYAYNAYHSATGNPTYDAIAGMTKAALDPRVASALGKLGTVATVATGVIAAFQQANDEKDEPYLPQWKAVTRSVVTGSGVTLGAIGGAYLGSVLASSTACASFGPWAFAACVGVFAVAGGIGGERIGAASASYINDTYFDYDKSHPVAIGPTKFAVVQPNCVQTNQPVQPLIFDKCVSQ